MRRISRAQIEMAHKQNHRLNETLTDANPFHREPWWMQSMQVDKVFMVTNFTIIISLSVIIIALAFDRNQILAGINNCGIPL
jgi:hypothetical protein